MWIALGLLALTCGMFLPFLLGALAVFTDSVAFSAVAALSPLLMFAVATILINRGLQLRTAQECEACGYDLRGCTENGCPECGWGRSRA